MPMLTLTCSSCCAMAVRRRQHGMELFSDAGCILRVLRFRTARPRIHRRPDGLRCRSRERHPQAFAHRLQQLVANRMSQRVIDMLEAIQVEKQHGQACLPRRRANAIAWSSRSFSSNRLGRSVRKSCWARWEISAPCPRLAHIAEHHHGAGDLPVLVVDRGDGVFDSPTQSRRAGSNTELWGRPTAWFFRIANSMGFGAGSRVSAVDNAQHLGQGTTERLLARPPRHTFARRD